MTRGRAAGLLALGLLLACSGLAVGAHPAAPSSGDHFSYFEVITLDNGQGNYTGYSEATFINGSIAVTGAPSGTVVPASYSSSTRYTTNQGLVQTFSSSGTFTFDDATYHYVNGTDNQSGYTNPYVWFYIDRNLGAGASFYLLNTQFTVASTNASAPAPTTSTGYARAIQGNGQGSYQRNDAYGVFTATYTWQANFDPGSGYVIGYSYDETDSDGIGDGFHWHDVLTLTSSSYALTAATAPPSTGTPSSGFGGALAVAILVLVVVVVLLVVVVVLARRRRPALARHGYVPPTAPGGGYPPPPGTGYSPAPLNFGNVSQPPVQQIVIKETVKTNCRYCGTLIDTTATVCPKCGAPRT